MAVEAGAELPADDADVVTLAAIEAARERLRPVVRPTPAEASPSLGARVGMPLWLKPEQRQRTGSFKIRGAYNRQSALGPGARVVAGSAGNHAQGVALAASLLGQSATIFMPRNASLPKVQATRAYGADVRLENDVVDDCIASAVAFAEEHGAVFVSPFDHPAIVCGQATIGLELLDEVPDLGTVVVAIGGGGLCGGIAAAVKAVHPAVRVVGVAAQGAASIVASLAAGAPRSVEPRTIADGIALRAPSRLTLDLIDRYVDDVVVVSDEAISRALLLLVERSKAVVEPAGAAPLAAVLEGLVRAGAGATAAVLGGGNIDPLLLTKLIEYGLSAAGRYLVFRAVMADLPGSLAGLTDTLADIGLNVLDVEHHRTGLRLPLNQVEIQMTVETRDEEHRHRVLADLTERGYEVELVV